MPAAENPDPVALRPSLARLAAIDERKVRIVELRYFGGLSIDDGRGDGLLADHRQTRVDDRQGVAVPRSDDMMDPESAGVQAIFADAVDR